MAPLPLILVAGVLGGAAAFAFVLDRIKLIVCRSLQMVKGDTCGVSSAFSRIAAPRGCEQAEAVTPRAWVLVGTEKSAHETSASALLPAEAIRMVQKMRSIQAALDRDERSKSVARRAVELARLTRAHLELLLCDAERAYGGRFPARQTSAMRAESSERIMGEPT